MVGVPGKYKGCNTCRLRRIKCDNQRPFCRKCLDSGRECQGYERERVFIVGTVDDAGRCSSHPPRIVKGTKRSKTASSSSASATPEQKPLQPPPKRESSAPRISVLATEPLRPAWEDLLMVTDPNSTANHRVQIAALNSSFSKANQNEVDDGGGGGDDSRFSVSLPPYKAPDVRPTAANGDFELHSDCILHLSPNEEGENNGLVTTDSILLFLYEHNNIMASDGPPPWQDPLKKLNPIKSLGPAFFRGFPAHHFFVRVYRHNHIFTALLNRTSTFLSEAEWTTIPWETHPKSDLDRLLDNVAQMPALIARSDRILLNEPTLARQVMAQKLLEDCLALQTQLDRWFGAMLQAAGGQDQLYWLAPKDNLDAQIPFGDPLAFRNSATSTLFVYYWTSLIVFWPCVEQINNAIYQPVIDMNNVYPPIYQNFPQSPMLPQTISRPQEDTTAAPIPKPSLFERRLSTQLQNLQPPPLQHQSSSNASSTSSRLLHIRDPRRYSVNEVRNMANNLCRSLDYALQATIQPDLLAIPLYVAEQFYGAIGRASGNIDGDGLLELMWLEGYRQRLVMKGQHIADVVQGKKWVGLARY